APIRGMLWARSGWFAFHLGRSQGKMRLRKGLEMARAQKNTADMTFALQYLSAIHSHNDQLAEAREMARQALAQAERLGDPYYLGVINNILADIGFRQSHFDESEAHSQRSLALIQASDGNLWSKTFSLTNLGRVAKAQLKYDEAASFFRQSLAVREEIGDIRGIALCYQYLGETAVENKQSQAARKYLYMAQSLLQQIGSLREASGTFLLLADLAYREGEKKDAAHYYGRVLTLAHEFDQTLYLRQALTGFTYVWRESHPDLVEDIDQYLQQLQPVQINLGMFGDDDDIFSSRLIPSAELKPLDLLVTKILTYLEVD
ncbi:MAG: tetratricopeptide repeat protein, partial [Sphaerospermopsis sp. SIO1G2]|nr:tetratricopeptide repeat protein [Sphaerospermopsis sp. SIO1G2]